MMVIIGYMDILALSMSLLVNAYRLEQLLRVLIQPIISIEFNTIMAINKRMALIRIKILSGM